MCILCNYPLALLQCLCSQVNVLEGLAYEEKGLAFSSPEYLFKEHRLMSVLEMNVKFFLYS